MANYIIAFIIAVELYAMQSKINLLYVKYCIEPDRINITEK